MFRYLSIIIFSSLVSLNLAAQSVSGSVRDAATNMAVSNATIKLQVADSSQDPMLTVSDATGHFNFDDIANGAYNLTVTSIGYAPQNKVLTVLGQDVNLQINISKTEETLSTVVINNTPPVRQNGDTLDYSANQYKVNPDATSEDLIKKMPGVTVDKNGTVTAQGETVKKVTVDGRDFFGDDATATLRNLPAEVVDKIQVFDKLSDQAQLTGFDDGNTQKSINIVTKKDMRNGNFGRVYGGYGTDDRYSGGGNVSFFNNDRRISLLGLFNNVNQQNFSSEDLIGATSGGRGGGGRRGGGGGGNFRGGSSNFMVGPQSGIAKTNAFGVNYSDAWGKKIDVTGSYFFNNSNTTNNQIINQQNFLTKDSSQYYDENTLSNTKNYNNRVNFRLTYRIDSSNTIIATSNLNFQNNNSVNNVLGVIFPDEAKQNAISRTENDLNSKTNGNSLSNMLLYRHAFAKRGRSISLGIFQSSNNRNGQNFLDAYNSYYKPIQRVDTVKQLSDQKSLTNQYRFSLEYTEPLAPKTQMQINYSPSFQTSNADQETSDFDDGTGKYSILDTSLSNKFNNTYNTQNAGITFRHGDRNNMIAAGVSYQYSELKSNQVFPQASKIDNTYSNFLANMFSRFKLSARSTLRVIYRGSVSPPSVTQLQNVINNTNPFFYTTGNPDLQQQYTNNLITRYTYTNTAKGQSFFANIFLQSINNYVTNASYTAASDSALSKSVILYKGSQISKPVNMNGYVNARSFFTFGTPIKFAKLNLNMNAGFSYARQPGMVNKIENISNAYNYNLGAVLSSNISEYIDFNLSYSANINTVKNTIQPALNNNYFTQSAGINANLLTKKGFFFQNNLSNESYKGLTDGFNQNYWLWNIAIGQKFLKKQAGELKLSVFDLLKQNKSITRDVTESYVQDQINQVLQQYFMLTFTYKLKNFGKGASTNNNDRGGFRRFGGFGGPPYGHGGPQL
ncbi:MAG TPA: outer membrane beta-barrel protein [Hanamia sp.]|nr:outer membrane beta-barrel protein [Hanamia sp.]